jgi:hypothetical protein
VKNFTCKKEEETLEFSGYGKESNLEVFLFWFLLFGGTVV